MAQRVLIMGLPGSGKTFLARELQAQLEAAGKSVQWFNADAVREQFDDWDFSVEGRIRQSVRMRELADKSTADVAIADFVAPIAPMRLNYGADCTVWVDTIKQSRFADTNKLFDPPDTYDIRVPEQDCKKWAKIVLDRLLGA